MLVSTCSYTAEACALPTPSASKFVKLETPKKLEAQHADLGDDLPKPTRTRRQKLLLALRIALLVILVSGVCVFVGFLIGSDKVQQSILDVFRWLGDMDKKLSAIIMIAIYAVALMFFCPGTPFNLAAGFLYGLWGGFGVAFGGCILGAMSAFFAGRTIAREWVKSKMEKKPKFQAVDWAIQKKGIYIVFLTRLSPLFPFPLLNYAFGITKVKAWQYLLGTAGGVFPATIAYTYLGTLMRNLTELWTTSADDIDTSEFCDTCKTENTNIVVVVIGALITLASIVIISLITKRAIDKATREFANLNGEDAPAEEDNDELSDVEDGTTLELELMKHGAMERQDKPLLSSHQ